MRPCLLFALLPLSALAVTCPLDSIYSDEFKACILIPTQELPWATSKSYCEYMGGQLAVIDTEEKNLDFMKISTQMIKIAQLTYIGGYSDYGMFQWIDGTKFDYNNLTAKTVPFRNGAIIVQVNSDNRGHWSEISNNYNTRPGCTIPSCDQPNRSTLNPQNETYGFIYSSTFNQWFIVADVDTDQSLAKPGCASLGGTLPIVNNAFQNVDLVQMLSLANAKYPTARRHELLGASSDANGTWTWQNGQPLRYTNWAPNEPRKEFPSNAEAIIEVETGLWYAQDSTYTGYICALPASPFQC